MRTTSPRGAPAPRPAASAPGRHSRAGRRQRSRRSPPGRTSEVLGRMNHSAVVPSATSTIRVRPPMLISSSPSSAETTRARSQSSPSSASAIVSWNRRSGDAEQLPARPGGIGQRTEQVEDRPHTELLAHTGDVLHRRDGGGANMNPNPSSSMQRETAGGSSSISTPSASSRSAEPQRLVLDRLPCLATAQPAPAATSAAAVEMLNVLGPPPVPAVSTRSWRPSPPRRRAGASSAPARPARPRSRPWRAVRSGRPRSGPLRHDPPSPRRGPSRRGRRLRCPPSASLRRSPG